MPTTHPRYTVTDTGELRDMLDLAQAQWPDVEDRRQLLLRLVALGGEAVAEQVGSEALRRRSDAQREALRRAVGLVDVDELLADAAWR